MKSVKDQVRNEWRNSEARDERSSAEMLTERLADPDADAATSPTACVSLDSAAGSGRVHWSCVGAGSDKRTRSVRRLPSYDRSLTKPHGYRGRVWLRLSILLPQSFLRLFSRISFFFFLLVVYWLWPCHEENGVVRLQISRAISHRTRSSANGFENALALMRWTAWP